MKHLLFFLAVFMALHGASQSTKQFFDSTGTYFWATYTTVFIPVSAKDRVAITSGYDSTENFLGNRPEQYVGQDLFLPGLPASLRVFGYDNFVFDPMKDEKSLRNTYKPILPVFDYERAIAEDDGDGSIYDSLAGKYFRVTKVIPHRFAKTSPKVFGRYAYLELVERKSGDVVYYKYDKEGPNEFPFVTVGFFRKQEKLVPGMKFVVRGDNWLQGNGDMIDLFTGMPVNFVAGSQWTCVDLMIESDYYSTGLILENPAGEHIFLPFYMKDSEIWIVQAEVAKANSKKYGQQNWLAMLSGAVLPGFTEEMVEFSWSRWRLDKAETGESWSYMGRTAWFENGVVVRVTDQE